MSRNDQITETALLAGIIGQIGCLTVIIIAIALGAGLLVDNFLGTRPIFTILFLVGSVPVTLYVSVRVSLMAVARARRAAERAKAEETGEA
ncbi:MAG: AtpZ/AtpI family protein [Candidatus Promineifilaceae bacterium]